MLLHSKHTMSGFGIIVSDYCSLAILRPYVTRGQPQRVGAELSSLALWAIMYTSWGISLSLVNISISTGFSFHEPFYTSLRDHFFFIRPGEYCMNMDLFVIVGTFRSNFLLRVGGFVPSPNRISFHVRSGDIMRRSSPPPQFAPAPCPYYL
jgi:hypothetical protein